MVAVTKQYVARYFKGSFVLSQFSFWMYLILRSLGKSSTLSLSFALLIHSLFMFVTWTCTRDILVFCRLHAIVHWRFNAPKREATVHVASRIDVRYSSCFVYQLFTSSEEIQTCIKLLTVVETKYCEVLEISSGKQIIVISKWQFLILSSKMSNSEATLEWPRFCYSGTLILNKIR